MLLDDLAGTGFRVVTRERASVQAARFGSLAAQLRARVIRIDHYVYGVAAVPGELVGQLETRAADLSRDAGQPSSGRRPGPPPR